MSSSSQAQQAREQDRVEAFELSREILRDVELGTTPLSAVAFKTSRLARLMNDTESQQMFGLEAGGYSTGAKILPNDRYQLALRAGRRTSGFGATGWSEQLVWTESIDALERQLEAGKTTLSNITGSQSPVPRYPGQYITPPTERQLAQFTISGAADKLASRRKLIHDYALGVHYELRYSGIAEDIFTRIRTRVDASIAKAVPEAVQKLASVYENLDSGNAEDWANAVHSCRRLLQALADRLSPATDEVRTTTRGGREIQIRYGKDQYINRLIRFVEDHSSSERFNSIVGSELGFLGDRLDAAFKASQKGSHAEVTRDEADRMVVHTYLVVGDILSLLPTNAVPRTAEE